MTIFPLGPQTPIGPELMTPFWIYPRFSLHLVTFSGASLLAQSQAWTMAAERPGLCRGDWLTLCYNSPRLPPCTIHIGPLLSANLPSRPQGLCTCNFLCLESLSPMVSLSSYVSTIMHHIRDTPITSLFKMSPKLPVHTCMHTHPHVHTLTLRHSHAHTYTHIQCWHSILFLALLFLINHIIGWHFIFKFYIVYLSPLEMNLYETRDFIVFVITAVFPVPKIVLNTKSGLHSYFFE